MSVLQKFKDLQARLKQAEEQHEQLKQNPEITKALEFEEMLKELMAEYGMSLTDIVAIVQPGAQIVSADDAHKPKQRKQRQARRYTNPHSGDSFVTRGGNHKTLKEWKQRWGTAVERWWIEV